METERPATYETDRLVLRPLGPDEAPAVLAFYRRNRAHLTPWEPRRARAFYTEAQQREILAVEETERRAGRALPLWYFRKDEPGRIAGRAVLSQIVGGAFQSAYLGYKVDGDLEGLGYASEAVGRLVRAGFEDLGLHRVEAHVMPRNLRSIRLLERLGFRPEGYGTRYLGIHGAWEDHLHFALLREEFRLGRPAPPSPSRGRSIELHGGRVLLRLPTEADIPALIDYRERNRERLDRWNPSFPEGGSSEAAWRKRVLRAAWLFESGREADFLVCLPDRPDVLVGSLTFRDIAAMPLSSCELGYSVDVRFEGRGYMHEALHTGLRFMFDVFGLHRANASHVVGNERSARLLDSLGFQREGVARSMLYVDGAWRDMVLTSLLRDDFA